MVRRSGSPTSREEVGRRRQPAPTPVRGPAKCGEVPDGDLGELNQLGELVGEKEEGTHHRRLPETPHT